MASFFIKTIAKQLKSSKWNTLRTTRTIFICSPGLTKTSSWSKHLQFNNAHSHFSSHVYRCRSNLFKWWHSNGGIKEIGRLIKKKIQIESNKKNKCRESHGRCRCWRKAFVRHKMCKSAWERAKFAIKFVVTSRWQRNLSKWWARHAIFFGKWWKLMANWNWAGCRRGIFKLAIERVSVWIRR